MAGRSKVQVISGSTRLNRICPDIARWVMSVGASDQVELELVDLLDWPLAMDDEPDIPATGRYTQDHTLAWSRKIAEAAGYVFVTPQYNWGYPAPLKNALDHLYREWSGKPAVIISYGFHGGGKCAAQLRQVLEGLRMRPALTMPALTLPDDMKTTGIRASSAISAFVAEIASIERAFAELAVLLETPAQSRA